MQQWMQKAIIKMERNGATMACKHGSDPTEYNFGRPRKSKAKIKAHVRWRPSAATKAILKDARAKGRDLLIPSAYARGLVDVTL